MINPSSRILDKVAISMALICGIHCLVTPVLLVALPLLATTFWVDENFHLWMILLVIPTTSLAIFSGCRRHKDKWVLASAIIGLGILVTALVTERSLHSHQHSEDLEPTLLASATPHLDEHATSHATGGGCCPAHPVEVISEETGETMIVTSAASLSWHALLNSLGGLFLIAGHSRNYFLCRKEKCTHEQNRCEGALK